MKQEHGRLAGTLLDVTKIAPPAIILGLAALCLIFRDSLNAQTILHYTPENLWLAALALLAFYAVKSLSVVFPLLALYVCAGLLFPVPLALAVNLMGLFVCVSLPYSLARCAGAGLLDKLQKRYPKIARLNELQQGSELFFAFFLRVVGVLPGDVVSMVLGATGMTYWKYVLGSLLGMLPGMVSATIAGASVSDPTSPVFLATAAFTVLLSAGSFLFWRRRERNRQSRP